MEAAKSGLARLAGDTVLVSSTTSALSSISSEEFMSQSQLVAVLLCDTGVKVCSEALIALENLARPIPGRQLLVLAVALESSAVSLEQFLSGSDPSLVAAAVSTAPSIRDLVMACGVRSTIAYPEVAFFSTATGKPVAVGAWSILHKKDQRTFVPSTFPHGWSTNVLYPSCLPLNDPICSYLGPSFGMARVHPDTALRLGVYPGDAVIVKPLVMAANVLGTNVQPSLCVYINPPAPDGVDEDAPIPCPPVGHVMLSPSVYVDLGLGRGEPGQAGQDEAVMITPYLDVPEAESITLAHVLPSSSSSSATPPATTTTSTSNSNRRDTPLLAHWFGLPSQEDSARMHELVEALAEVRSGTDEQEAAAAAVQRLFQSSSTTPTPAPTPSSFSPGVMRHVSQQELQWLTAHARRAACIYAVVSTGQTVCAPLATPWHTGPSDQPVSSYTASLGHVEHGQQATLACYRVVRTEPKYSAVVVGPDTRLQVEQAP